MHMMSVLELSCAVMNRLVCVDDKSESTFAVVLVQSHEPSAVALAVAFATLAA